MRDDKAEWLTRSRNESRQLALEAGSGISSRPGDPDLVLANTYPVLDFLLGGDLDGEHDMLARRRAVRAHLHNIKSLRNGGHLTGRDDPETFLTAVRQYYALLSPPPPSQDVRKARMLALITARGDAGMTVREVAITLYAETGTAVTREALHKWASEYERDGMLARANPPRPGHWMAVNP